MPVGMQVINDTGSFIIDGNYANLQRSKSGITTSGTGSPVSFGTQVIVPAAQVQTPVMAFRATDRSVFPWMGYPSGGSGYVCDFVASTIRTNVEWFLFDSSWAMPDPAKLGLEIFNEQGQLIFNSGYRNFRIVDVVTVNAAGLGFSQTATQTKTYPAGRKYAAMVASPSMGVENRRSICYDWSTGVHFSGTTAIFTNVIGNAFDDGLSPSPGWRKPNATIFIIDVTAF